MRTEAEIRARLDVLKYDMKEALKKGMTWHCTNYNYEIKALEWVLGCDEK